MRASRGHQHQGAVQRLRQRAGEGHQREAARAGPLPLRRSRSIPISKPQLAPLRLRGRNDAEAWVRDGLPEGAQVIVYPPAQLRDGARVQVRDVAQVRQGRSDRVNDMSFGRSYGDAPN
ncbi:hypothetical protein [Massilia antarctica]|uniref:hypothetical protein n=1 Tax=Massilia antarctica TaxID=2765360 RepID=UPI0006BB9229|nr:hypothetical protein [Massilia sp. H27-R4]MCY0914252.1 hypothetical protein [Massilia sp. H27-R4]